MLTLPDLEHILAKSAISSIFAVHLFFLFIISCMAFVNLSVEEPSGGTLSEKSHEYRTLSTVVPCSL